ncbi:MAG: calcium/sodium antiporter [Sphingorhabdus sp.]
MLTALAMIGGLALLVLGAELLVRGAVRLAEGMGVSSLLIGLTVVGFGTSTPELVTSVQAAMVGSPGIAIGNIVGSNIFNILVILGLAAVIWPLAVSATALRRDGVIVIATAAALAAIGWFATLSRPVGAAFVLLLALYIYAAWRQERQLVPNDDNHGAAYDKGEALEALDPGLSHEQAAPSFQKTGWILPSLTTLAGLALLVFGARFFVDGSIDLARTLGVSETIIGLTIVAAGTSMPELATSGMAAWRRQSDVAVGNILGSNIYNILGIGGITAMIAPTAIPPQIVAFDNPVMIGVSVLLLLFLWTGRTITRFEGGLLILGYIVYVWAIWPR